MRARAVTSPRERAWCGNPTDAEGIFAELCKRAGASLAPLIGTVSADLVSAHDLLTLLKMSGAALFGRRGLRRTLPGDGARRALASDDYIHNAVDTSFALELLADRGIAVPGWNETAEPPPAPRRVEEPAEIARTISREGLSIVQAGFDAAGRLVRVSTVGGRIQVPVREPDEVMREERFKLWAAEPVLCRRGVCWTDAPNCSRSVPRMASGRSFEATDRRWAALCLDIDGLRRDRKQDPAHDHAAPRVDLRRVRLRG